MPTDYRVGAMICHRVARGLQKRSDIANPLAHHTRGRIGQIDDRQGLLTEKAAVDNQFHLFTQVITNGFQV